MEVRNFFRAVAVMAIAVLFGQTVVAQNEIVNVADTAKVVEQQVINQIKGEVHYGIDPAVTLEAAWNVLKAAPADTLITTAVEIHTDTTVTRCKVRFELSAKDTLFVHLRYFMAEKFTKDTLCVLNEHVTELVPVMSPLEQYVDSLSQLTKAWDKVSSGREQDRYGYRVRFDNGNEYTITTKFNDKFGWNMGPYVGGEFAEGILGATAGCRLGYNTKWLAGTLDAGLGYNRYEANAEEQFAGDQMLTFQTRAMAWVNIAPFLFKGDRYLVHRLEIGAGAGFRGFKTKSREVTNPDGSVYLVQSEGNAFYWAAGIKYTHRQFNQRWSWFVEAGVEQITNVWQNRGQQAHVGGYVTVGLPIDMFRNHAKWAR